MLRDGDIAWRLVGQGGDDSEFEADFTFSGQNHARIASHNASQTVISFFDNSEPEQGNSSSSRGLLVALKTDTKPMTAKLVAEFPHPHGPGSYVKDFGSTQVLPNGHVFSGWVDGLLLGEHDSNGHLIMEAHVEGEAQAWMKTSRAYKFPFLGQPAQPPDVSAEVLREDSNTQTIVHASWNGATEVEGWKVYSTTRDGAFETSQLVAEAAKQGFETEIAVSRVADYVVVEAVDGKGEVLGRSEVVLAAGSMLRPGEEIEVDGGEKFPPDDNGNEDEEEKIPTDHDDNKASQATEAAPTSTPTSSSSFPSSWKDKAKAHSNGIFSFLGVLIFAAAVFFLIRYWLRRRRSNRSWTTAAAAGKHNRKPSDHELFRRDRDAFALDGDGDESDGYEYDEDNAGR